MSQAEVYGVQVKISMRNNMLQVLCLAVHELFSNIAHRVSEIVGDYR